MQEHNPKNKSKPRCKDENPHHPSPCGSEGNEARDDGCDGRRDGRTKGEDCDGLAPFFGFPNVGEDTRADGQGRAAAETGEEAEDGELGC